MITLWVQQAVSSVAYGNYSDVLETQLVPFRETFVPDKPFEYFFLNEDFATQFQSNLLDKNDDDPLIPEVGPFSIAPEKS
jgi:hypothetical protein